METALNCFCPSCGAALTPQLGCGARCLTVAIQLQSARFGTEVLCTACGRHHIVRRINASRDVRTSVYLWRTDDVRLQRSTAEWPSELSPPADED